MFEDLAKTTRATPGEQGQCTVARISCHQQLRRLEFADIHQLVPHRDPADLDRRRHGHRFRTEIDHHLLEAAPAMLLCGQQSINAHAIRHLGLIIALDLDVQNDAIIEFDEQIGDSLLDDRELDVQESADLASTGVSSKDARPVPLKQILDHRIVADRINPARSCWFGHDPSVETGGPVRPYPPCIGRGYARDIRANLSTEQPAPFPSSGIFRSLERMKDSTS